MILLVDNYDSFAHNLARYLRQLGGAVVVARNDDLAIEDVARMCPAAIVMSPGPCTPDEAGICLELVKAFHTSIPMLGVCLGHQTICQALGGKIERNRPVHGRASKVHHAGHPLFNGIPSPFAAGRYHSLVAPGESLPEAMEVLAWSEEERTVMAVGHRDCHLFGVQFHPESVLTEGGYRLLANFLELAGIGYNESPDRLQRQCMESCIDVQMQKPVPATSGPPLPYPHPLQ
jgi:anthranilate synthase/aminodeoxychorismate synthase-like glutamine amidotransferase